MIGRFIRSRKHFDINLGAFSAQINEAEKLLVTTNLFAERNYNPGYGQLKAADFRNISYIDVWKKCYDNRYFDFRLIDDALLQFRVSFNPLEISYAYYECPYQPLISFEQFFEQEQLMQGDNFDEYELIRQYELLTRRIKDVVTPLRYDYAPQLYKEGLHPASHIHFGHGNHIRVATKRLLKPLSFVLFLIRQCYPDQWRITTQLKGAETLCRNISTNLTAIDGVYWRPLDNWEMVLA